MSVCRTWCEGCPALHSLFDLTLDSIEMDHRHVLREIWQKRVPVHVTSLVICRSVLFCRCSGVLQVSGLCKRCLAASESVFWQRPRSRFSPPNGVATCWCPIRCDHLGERLLCVFSVSRMRLPVQHLGCMGTSKLLKYISDGVSLSCWNMRHKTCTLVVTGGLLFHAAISFSLMRMAKRDGHIINRDLCENESRDRCARLRFCQSKKPA